MRSRPLTNEYEADGYRMLAAIRYAKYLEVVPDFVGLEMTVPT